VPITKIVANLIPYKIASHNFRPKRSSKGVTGQKLFRNVRASHSGQLLWFRLYPLGKDAKNGRCDVIPTTCTAV